MNAIHIYNVIRVGILIVGLSVCLLQADAEGIRIIPHSILVRNDSLHLSLEMDLNAVRVNTLTAISFTPILKGNREQLELAPVVITGNKRYRFERRERALTDRNTPLPIPYLILKDNRKTGSKHIQYEVSTPYVSWMRTASLLLRQEIKDCCDLQLLGVDTLVQHITLKGFPEQNPKHSPVPMPDTRTQKSRTVPRGKITSKTIHTTDSVLHIINSDKPSISAIPCQVREPESLVLYFDYPIGKDDIHPEFKNNRYEIDKIDRLFAPLRREHFVSVRSIRICGYSSPDGNYGNNEQLAEARSRFFSIYLRSVYGVPRGLVKVSSVAEDWEGLVDLLERDNPSYREAVLRLISRYGIFNGRERHLIELQGGYPYKDMLKHFFPRLRRIEVIVRYEDDKTKYE